jgi:hypothetical protein
VPVLIQGYPDDLKRLSPRRRDAYCGKISVSNNLVQAGIKFSLTQQTRLHPTSETFERDLKSFLGVCRVVNGCAASASARSARGRRVQHGSLFGKTLERHGISVTTWIFPRSSAKPTSSTPSPP